MIVNRGQTRGDDLATLKLDAGCAETLAGGQWGATASGRTTSPECLFSGVPATVREPAHPHPVRTHP